MVGILSRRPPYYHILLQVAREAGQLTHKDVCDAAILTNRSVKSVLKWVRECGAFPILRFVRNGVEIEANDPDKLLAASAGVSDSLTSVSYCFPYVEEADPANVPTPLQKVILFTAPIIFWPILVVRAALSWSGENLSKLQNSVVSVFVFIAALAAFVNLNFAIVVTMLIGVHEFGHMVAFKRLGAKIDPPIFIPFAGAVINTNVMPKNAWEEAITAAAGPLIGMAGVFVAMLIVPYTGGTIWPFAVLIGIMINLFNLLPLLPLDGGRMVAFLPRKVVMYIYIATGMALFAVGLGSHPVVLFVMVVGILTFIARKKSLPENYRDIGIVKTGILTLLYIGSVWFVGEVFLTIGPDCRDLMDIDGTIIGW